MKDFLWLLKAIKKHQIQHLVLEKQDFRSASLAKFIPITTPNKEIKNVYQNRQELFSQIYGHVFDNSQYSMSVKTPKRF